MEDLPNEILMTLCASLNDSHQPSLDALSRVSKRMRSVALAERVRHLIIHLKTRDDIARITQRYDDLLRSTGFHAYVYTVEVTTSATARNNGDSALVWKIDESEALWQPLAELIARLTSLKDFIYNCQARLTQGIQVALSTYVPSCKMHLNHFSFSSFDPLKSDEVKLALSPNLVTVKATWTPWYSNGTENYHKEAIWDMVGGLTPNLRCLHLSPGRTIGSPAVARIRREGRERKPWPGFGVESPRVRARLQELYIRETRIEKSDVELWVKNIDFSYLRILHVGGELTESAWMALSQISCPSLHTLTVPLFESMGVTFLSNLPSLRDLTLHGGMDGIVFKTIIEHHGSTLRILSLPRAWWPRLQDLRQLKLCSHLQELYVTIQRNHMSGNEAALYRALGSIRSLQNLTLYLDVSMRLSRPDDAPVLPLKFEGPDLDVVHVGMMRLDEVCDIRVGHVREALINGAVDESLARAIFTTIDSRKKDGARLDTLTLRPVGGAMFGQPGYDEFVMQAFQEVGRHWKIERSIRDDEPNEVGVQEIDAIVKRRPALPLMGPIQGIFRRIWPEKEGSKWEDDWHSFPLNTSALAE